MPGLDSSHLSVADVLSFGVWILMALMVINLGAWFACSIVENIVKMARRVRHPNYNALLRENERLRGSLADAQGENDYLRKLYHRDLPPRTEDGGRNAVRSLLAIEEDLVKFRSAG